MRCQRNVKIVAALGPGQLGRRDTGRPIAVLLTCSGSLGPMEAEA